MFNLSSAIEPSVINTLVSFITNKDHSVSDDSTFSLIHDLISSKRDLDEWKNYHHDEKHIHPWLATSLTNFLSINPDLFYSVAPPEGTTYFYNKRASGSRLQNLYIDDILIASTEEPTTTVYDFTLRLSIVGSTSTLDPYGNSIDVIRYQCAFDQTQFYCVKVQEIIPFILNPGFAPPKWLIRMNGAMLEIDFVKGEPGYWEGSEPYPDYVFANIKGLLI